MCLDEVAPDLAIRGLEIEPTCLADEAVRSFHVANEASISLDSRVKFAFDSIFNSLRCSRVC